jgi:hypothetical protein
MNRNPGTLEIYLTESKRKRTTIKKRLNKEDYEILRGFQGILEIPPSKINSPGWAGHTLPSYNGSGFTGILLASGEEYWIIETSEYQGRGIILNIQNRSIGEVIRDIPEWEKL